MNWVSAVAARVTAWLDDVPIPDRFERRNARTVQIFCIGFAILLLAAVASNALWRPNQLAGFARWYGTFANWASIAVCVWSVRAVRRGHAAAAFRALLVVFAGVLVVSLALRGAAIHEHLFARTYAVLLVLAAFLLGRKALWTTLAVLLGGIGLGYLHDNVWSGPTEPVPPAEGNLLRAAEVALLLCVLIDRFGVALREAYAASRLRESELENALRSLREESEMRGRAEALLVQSQRLEALGRMSGGLAHDFNNILMAVRGFTDLARQAIPRDNPAHASLEQVQAASDRATGLTRQLMTFARRQIAEPRVIDAQEQVRLALPLLARLLGEDTVIETRFTAEKPHVRIDPVHLGQVLVNLAVNARDAMPAGGAFRIEVSEPVDGAGRWVELACTDSGTGMDAETARRAFDPFFTTKDPGQGTGLGLATCHGIVCQAGGSIAVETSPGRGATFRVRLPRTEEPLDSPGEARRPARAARARGETILVVEDDAQIRALVGKVLTTAGYRVCTAESPEAALELCGRSSLVPDLLLADLIMPGGSGKGLAETLRAGNPAMAVLTMSGHAADSVGRGIVVGSEGGHLRKPFTPDELQARVDELLDARESVAPRHDASLAP